VSRILYITAVNCDQKHVENSKIGLDKSWIFSPSERVEPCITGAD